MRGVCRVAGDGGMRSVRAEGQWGCVDVVVVQHRARQHQLEQTARRKDKNVDVEQKSTSFIFIRRHK